MKMEVRIANELWVCFAEVRMAKELVKKRGSVTRNQGSAKERLGGNAWMFF